ncbi:uncharacterized protein LOC122369701 [Amphibalanus amphitrite]|uniref:uncharacterized protein LOC122369701 n=1 Tax=Amphibalanus amphitrite TaxID=1232801 RepID=UPI001C913730|nr:uncharacterized protein LOC122369701 [Amphibalanus amphitrite]
MDTVMGTLLGALRHNFARAAEPMTAPPVKEGQDKDGQDNDGQDKDGQVRDGEEDANQRYDPAQDAAEKTYHAGEAAGRAAAEAASSGFTGPRKHDPVKTGGLRVYESDSGTVSVGVGASSDGTDHGVGAGLRLEW